MIKSQKEVRTTRTLTDDDQQTISLLIRSVEENLLCDKDESWIDQLAQFEEAAIVAIISAIEAGQATQIETFACVVVEVLSQSHIDPTAQITQALSSENVDVLTFACVALRGVYHYQNSERDQRSASALLQCVHSDTHGVVRNQATLAILEMHRREAVEKLPLELIEECLRSPGTERYGVAVNLVAVDLHFDKVYPVLLEGLEQFEMGGIQDISAGALGEMGDPTAIEPLRRAFEICHEKDPKLASIIQQSIETIFLTVAASSSTVASPHSVPFQATESSETPEPAAPGISTTKASLTEARLDGILSRTKRSADAELAEFQSTLNEFSGFELGLEEADRIVKKINATRARLGVTLCLKQSGIPVNLSCPRTPCSKTPRISAKSAVLRDDPEYMNSNTENHTAKLPSLEAFSPNSLLRTGGSVVDPVHVAVVLESLFDGVQPDAIENVDYWLASLEGQSFEYDDGIELIHSINRLVRRAERQLFYNNIAVTLHGVRGTQQKNVNFQLRDSDSKPVLNSVKLPLLTIIPNC